MIRRILCLIYLFGCLSFLQKIKGSEANVNVAFDNINEVQGLVHNYVLSIFQDSRGLIWTGTYGGLQMYDGYRFNRFNISIKRSNILSNHVVNVIFEDSEKNLWFGTENGLNKYTPKTGEIKCWFHEPGYPFGLSHNHIRTIYQDDDGDLWIGTYGGGLNCFDETTGKAKHFKAEPGNPNALQSDLVNTFFVDKNGLFWIGTESGGISVFDKEKKQFVKTFTKSDQGLNNNTINAIFQDRDGVYWIGTWGGGLIKYDPVGQKFTSYKHNPTVKNSISGNNVRSIAQTEPGKLWIATFGEGLNLFDVKQQSFTKIKTNYFNEENTAGDMIWTQIVDNDNNLWLGTFGNGILKMNSTKNTFFYKIIKDDEGKRPGISSVVENENNKLWLGTLNKGIFEYDLISNKISSLPIKSLKNLNISNLYKDRKNRIWICSDNALFLLDKNKLRTFKHDVFNSISISEGSVNAILEDSKSNIWIGFWGMGINMIQERELKKTNDEEVVFLKYKTDLPDPSANLDYRIWKIFEDSKGIVWIGTAKNLIRYSHESKEFKSFPVGVASSFYEDLNGNLWIGSIGNGLFKLDRNRNIVKRYTTENGLGTADILSIVADRQGRLWLGTPEGITLFNPINDDFSNFDKNYGLQRFSIGHNGGLMLSNGQLVFAGFNGFNIFIPEKIELNLPESPLIYTDIKTNNKSIAYENVLDSSYSIKSAITFLDTLVLDYRNKTLTIDFAAANYSIPTGISYGYKLEGFDQDWVLTGYNRNATFSNLKPGEYIFKLKMSYNNGKWTEGKHKLKLIVPPPFWDTVWFKFILFGLGLYFVYLLYNFRISQLNKRYEKDRLKKEREIIHLQNEKLNSELDFKNRELAQSTMHIIRKNEDIIELKNMLQDIVDLTLPEGKKKINTILKHISQKLDDSSNWEYFEYNFNLIHNNFLKRFTEKYPDINQNDLKICAYIRMNLSTKEMGNLLNVSYRTIESTRYRIRKKINIDTDQTLNEYIMRF